MSAIKLLILDVDGTMTDGGIYISDLGEIFKKFNVKDGYGIKKALQKGILIAIISGRQSKIVSNRATELGITEVYQGILDKYEILQLLIKKYDLKKENIAGIGDDENDLPILENVGISFAPSDANEQVKKQCDVILKEKGGEGAVRECIETILINNQKRIP